MLKKIVSLVLFGSAASIVSSCSNADTPPTPAMQKTASWKTACIGRLLIDTPSDVELSAADPKQAFAQTFTGIDDFGGNGIIYRGVELSETHPVDIATYTRFSDEILSSTPVATYFVDVVHRLGVLKQGFEEDLRIASPEARPGIIEQLDIVKRDYQLAQWGKKVSGKARTADPNSFAVREEHAFKAAFYDKHDGRLRYLAGQLPKQSPDSPEAAAQALNELRSRYSSRAATDIANLGPGFCTPYGFIDESKGGVSFQGSTEFSLMFRSRKQPALVFKVEVSDAGTQKKAGNIQDLPGMAADQAKLDPMGIKQKYGPFKITILGAPGRSVGYRYGDNCSKTSCRPADQLYAIEAETLGEAGHADRPRVVLHMSGLNSDQFRAASGADVRRPGLKGTVPPPFDEAASAFEHILKSIRMRQRQ